MPTPCTNASSPSETAAAAAIRAYVAAPDFPCVGARSAFNRGRAHFGSYGCLAANTDVGAICEDLRRFSAQFPDPGNDPVTFVATFADNGMNEARFAEAMWACLQAIHEYDSSRFAWNRDVSANPSASDFSFSVAGRAFFVVGLHPAASRLARRAPVPCLVFNFHDQFEKLRASGKYDGLQKVIRRRDVELQGFINPVLARFGEQSEARQYSGLNLDEAWTCPFHQVEAGHAA